jgi:hypothetical protein
MRRVNVGNRSVDSLQKRSYLWVKFYFNGFASVSVRLEEFPKGGLWGVCFEADANITSEQGRGNKKQSPLMAPIKKSDVRLLGHACGA